MTGWYWGELRAACSRGDWPRAWQLVAAWPVVPEAEAEAAQEYVVAEAARLKETSLMLKWHWVLEHYRAQPLGSAYDARSGCDQEHSYGGVGRIFYGAHDCAVEMDLRYKGGLVMEVRRNPRLLNFGGHNFHDSTAAADVWARAGAASRACLELLGQLLKGEEPRLHCPLFWDEDVRRRMTQDGPEAHPHKWPLPNLPTNTLGILQELKAHLHLFKGWTSDGAIEQAGS